VRLAGSCRPAHENIRALQDELQCPALLLGQASPETKIGLNGWWRLLRSFLLALDFIKFRVLVSLMVVVCCNFTTKMSLLFVALLLTTGVLHGAGSPDDGFSVIYSPSSSLRMIFVIIFIAAGSSCSSLMRTTTAVRTHRDFVVTTR
jgi:hypothetical protein